jgi:hypothetical protein
MAGLGAALVNVANALYAQADNWDVLEGLIVEQANGVAEKTGGGNASSPADAAASTAPGQAVPA